MSSYEIFEPVNSAPANPDSLVVMPSILGGNLRDKADPSRVSDLGQRAQTLADASGFAVMAIQRTNPDDLRSRTYALGLPRAYDASDYTKLVADEAAQIDKEASTHGASHISLVGVSAGGERGLAHVTAGLHYKSLFVFDPPAMQHSSAGTAFGRWATYQAKVALQDALGKPNYPNENPLEYKAQGEITALADLALHRDIWTQDNSFATLMGLAYASVPGMKNTHTHLIIPKNTFNLPPGQAPRLVRALNLIATIVKSDFIAQTTDQPHRVTDDPVRLARMVQASGILPDYRINPERP
ncbi:MAG: hypothetical protein WAQ24_05890 [Candidatus Saccharimonadales bacterium]